MSVARLREGRAAPAASRAALSCEDKFDYDIDHRQRPEICSRLRCEGQSGSASETEQTRSANHSAKMTSKPKKPSQWAANALKVALILGLSLAQVAASSNQSQASGGGSPAAPNQRRLHQRRNLTRRMSDADSEHSDAENDIHSTHATGRKPAAAPGSSMAPTLPTNQQQILAGLQQQQHESLDNNSRPRSLDCTTGLLTFELSTGFIYKPTSALETLAMMPSTLQLTDCLDFCLNNSSCLAINFEMGLCVLLATSAEQSPQNLYSSQFPVFTIYAEKKCLLSDPELASRRRRHCQRAWTFERVAGFEMKLRPRKRLQLGTRELCMDACLAEQEFECRSANWYRQTGECSLSDQDRHSVSQSEAGDQQVKHSLSHFYGPAEGVRSAQNQTAPATSYASHYAAGETLGSKLLPAAARKKLATGGAKLPAKTPAGPHYRTSSAPAARQLPQDWPVAPGDPSILMSQHHYIDLPANTPVDYLENNCVYEPNKLCEFRKIQNRVLKTVDSIYQEVGSLEECKQKCLQAPYRCYSFDYGDTSERVCRTSHLDQASLLSVNEPYLEVVGAITYELATCFNVTIQCRAREMVAQVSSSKSFQGKIYAKSRPSTCVTDAVDALQFELAMGYHDDACDVRASSDAQQGLFSNEIVIQHHDRIMTTQDVGLSVFCRYDLGNRNVSNNIDLAIEPVGDEDAADGPVASKQAGAIAQGSLSSGHKSPLTITGLATTVVRSPNVTMRITNMNGQPVTAATVGDRLALLFEVKEKTSPFGIFVREIVAMDGRQYLQQQHKLHHHPHQHANRSLSTTATDAHNDNNQNDIDEHSKPASILYYASGSESSSTASTTPQSRAAINDSLIESMYQTNPVNSIQFIDSDGCPTDANLMGPLVKMDSQGHRLLAPFDAFKFPTSDMVFFRAVVTSCLAECKPAVCPNLSSPTTTSAPHSFHTPARLSDANSNSIIVNKSGTPVHGGESPKGIAQLATF